MQPRTNANRMTQICLRFGIGCLCLAGVVADPFASAGAPPDVPSSTVEMAELIDRRLADQWHAAGVTPAELATDSEFIRRVYLDLTGVVPSVGEVRRFLEDPAADKRTALIEQRLQSPRYAMHMSNVWRDILLPELRDSEQLQSAGGLQRWMQRQFATNLAYDAWVADFLIADRAGVEDPGIFYTTLQLQPEKLAARTSQVFLGIQMQCAECHDHPFDNWTQHDFWGYAAFFAQVERKPDGGPGRGDRLLDRETGDVMLPDTTDPVSPKLPRGREVGADEGGTRRQQLSIWMASRDNPFLSRALVNRVWAQMFGRGFVEPVDDMNPKNLPSHPELLDELATYFARSGFDLQQLFRTLASTRAYQMSSRTPESVPDPKLFAVMSLKTLTPDQLFDSLQILIALPEEGNEAMVGLTDPRRREFVALMQGQSRSAAEYDRGVSQALMLMNGPLIGGATNHEVGRLLAGLSAPFLSDNQRIDTLFLATLTRYPTDAERQMLATHLGSQSTDSAKRQAIGDMLWAIVNSAEFSVNH